MAGTCPHGGLVQIIFLSKWVMAVGSMLIFQGVRTTYTTPVLRSSPHTDFTKLRCDGNAVIVSPRCPPEPSWLFSKAPEGKCVYHKIKYCSNNHDNNNNSNNVYVCVTCMYVRT